MLNNSNIDSLFNKKSFKGPQELFEYIDYKKTIKEWGFIIPLLKRFIYKFIYRNPDDSS